MSKPISRSASTHAVSDEECTQGEQQQQQKIFSHNDSNISINNNQSDDCICDNDVIESKLIDCNIPEVDKSQTKTSPIRVIRSAPFLQRPSLVDIRKQLLDKQAQQSCELDQRATGSNLSNDEDLEKDDVLELPAVTSRSLITGTCSSRKSSIAPSIIEHEFDIHSLGNGDFESAYTTHKLSECEREVMNTLDSFDYLPSNSPVFRQWLSRQPARLDWDRWLMMALIGICIGLVGFFLHQIIYLLSDIKWKGVYRFIYEGRIIEAWSWCMGYSVTLAAISAASVVFIAQTAGGSGIPEVIGFLNGIAVRRVLNLSAFCVKFLSCVLAVGAGLPVGPEGPMIHIGSTVGTGLSQCKSKTFRISLPFFARFRNSEDRRNFTTAGAAAGVSAAFGAPVGGLLFAMEEVSSFWSMKLGWMIFFCCTLATFTADIFNSSFKAFRHVAPFGLFQTDKYLVFKLHSMIPVNVIMFIPAVVLGLIGGVLGSMFTITNLKIARLRGRVLNRVTNRRAQKFIRFVEPPVIMILWAAITMFLPSVFPCQPLVCPDLQNRLSYHTPGHNITHKGCPANTANYSIDYGVQHYWCEKAALLNDTVVGGEYNEVASLMNMHIQKSLRLLYSRRTHYQFGYSSLLSVLPIYFLFSCWAAGSAIASGIVLPMLFIGGLYGRALGRLLVDIYGSVPSDQYWQWIDPGALALIGSASFFGGVSRLTMSLTVIMIEITNDVAFLLPTMVAILVSKWVGDHISHSLYHSLLEHKGIPYLHSQPFVYDELQRLLNLELFKARHVMNSPVLTLSTRESLSHLAHVLKHTTHGGFPVVKAFHGVHDDSHYGLINRSELYIILCHTETLSATTPHETISPDITYEELAGGEKPIDEDKLQEVLDNYISNPLYTEIFINLEEFINQSSPHIEEEFSLHRTYILFRTLGLRHLTVVDRAHQVVGIISRKDLMGFHLQEKLGQRKRRGYSVFGGTIKSVPAERLNKINSGRKSFSAKHNVIEKSSSLI